MAGEVESSSQYQGKKRALIISVSQYDKLEPLEFCEKDGSKMYEVLKQLDYEIPIKYRLIGGRVEYDSLRDSIIDFFSDPIIHPKDTILFYFSGHGLVVNEEHYLSTSEIDPDRPRRRGFSFDDLSKAREDCNSKTIFTILDCCYSGADTPGSKGPDAKANDAKELIKMKSKIAGEGKCILTACKPMQQAYEYKQEGHSFFTFFLAEALSNGACGDENGDVTPYALNEYIDNKIRSLPPEIRPKQNPFLNCSTAGKIVVAHYSKEIEPKSDYILKLLGEERIDEFNKIRKEEDTPLYYLVGLDLRGKNISGVDLHEADLSYAKLTDAKLIRANLIGAKLKGADLSGADLRSANLYGADLSMANLSRTDLRAADLKGMVDFSGANLSKADIRGVDLTGMVDFSGATLHDVNFTGSVTDKLINFSGADIRNVRGLPVLHEPNKYSQALNFFFGYIKEQFKIHNIPVERAEPIEESLKELVKEIEETDEQDTTIKKQNIKDKLIHVIENVVKILPKGKKEIISFDSLKPFSKLIGEDIQQIIQDIHVDVCDMGIINGLKKESSFIREWGSYGDGDGEFNDASGVAVDPKTGNVYVADTHNNRIQKFDSNGNFITKWGSGQRLGKKGNLVPKWLSGEDAKFYHPYAVAVDQSGNVYVADSGATRIQKFDSNGKFITKWRSGRNYEIIDTNGVSPSIIAIYYKLGYVYVPGNDLIKKFDSNGKFITKWGPRYTRPYLIGDIEGKFGGINDITVDGSCYVYVGVHNNIYKFDSNGKFITEWYALGILDIKGLAANYKTDNVYVADSNHIVVFDSNGKFITEYTPRDDKCPNDLKRVAVNYKTDELYVASGSCIKVLSTKDA